MSAAALTGGVMGMSFGAVAVTSGLSVWLTVAMSVLVFAGGAQFTAVGVAAAGAGPVATVLAGLLVNARLLPFGLAVGGVFGQRWPARLLGSYLMIDQSVAFALAQRDPERARAVYWASSLAAFLTWNTGTLLGALIGSAVGDPKDFGLDAVFPAGMLALILPQLSDKIPRRVALLGGLIAVATAPLLPPGLPVLLGLLGLAAALPVPKWKRRTA
ncbi:AzlC family ABC transporter permease [Crossiella sp. CA-258035]|uniref:AzlC family ABC transporter permease n=1 Tax=Crossiella sp. CA-258035 TaxID=2981138 RepID=UPI0032DA4322